MHVVVLAGDIDNDIDLVELLPVNVVSLAIEKLHDFGLSLVSPRIVHGFGNG